MKLSFTAEGFDLLQLDLDKEIEIENIKALIEAETQIPASQQTLIYNGNAMANDKSTLKDYGVQENDIILIRKAGPRRQANPDQVRMEQIRQQILNDPYLISRLAQNNPPLLEAARDPNPQGFYQVLAEHEKRAKEEEIRRQREIEALEADPFDPVAQEKIAELIRQENINSNMELAIEYVPEAFGNVFMLYINCVVNGFQAKAFVDSGAQMTIMSSSYAEKCGLLRLMDKRWTGLAKGVGEAKILGRVHMTQLQIETLFLPCSFTILENQPMDILFGLDMLKRHNCIIDLSRNVLRIGDVESRFLGENEIPKNDLATPPISKPGAIPNISSPSISSQSPAQHNPTQITSNPLPQIQQSKPLEQPQQQQKPVATTTTPASRPVQNQNQNQTQPGQGAFPEDHIQTLMSFGATRQQAIEALIAAGGNPDIAAGFFF